MMKSHDSPKRFKAPIFRNLAANLKDSSSFVNLAVLPCPRGLNDGIQFIQLAPNLYLLVQADPKLNVHNMRIP